MSGHTSGPWVVSSTYLVCTLDGVVISKSIPVGIPALDPPHAETIRNVVLQAAAPELLAIVQEAIDRGPIGGDEWGDRARAIVSKATGSKP